MSALVCANFSRPCFGVQLGDNQTWSPWNELEISKEGEINRYEVPPLDLSRMPSSHECRGVHVAGMASEEKPLSSLHPCSSDSTEPVRCSTETSITIELMHANQDLLDRQVRSRDDDLLEHPVFPSMAVGNSEPRVKPSLQTFSAPSSGDSCSPCADELVLTTDDSAHCSSNEIVQSRQRPAGTDGSLVSDEDSSDDAVSSAAPPNSAKEHLQRSPRRHTNTAPGETLHKHFHRSTAAQARVSPMNSAQGNVSISSRSKVSASVVDELVVLETTPHGPLGNEALMPECVDRARDSVPAHAKPLALNAEPTHADSREYDAPSSGGSESGPPCIVSTSNASWPARSPKDPSRSARGAFSLQCRLIFQKPTH